MIKTVTEAGLITQIDPIPEIPGLFVASVRTDGTPYEYGLGQFNMYFRVGTRPGTFQAIGFSDYYNFDAQHRGFFKETLGAIARFSGFPFNIRWGITPSQQFIDMHYKQ